MSADPFLDLTRSLAVERRLPVHDEAANRETRELADLRAVIHILAKAMGQGMPDHAAMEAS